MNRRSGPWFVRILFALALVAGPIAPQTASASSTDPTVPPTTLPTDEIVIDEANPFLPENRDLTDCIGTLQRPGCGSEARGGWHQNAVAIVMIERPGPGVRSYRVGYPPRPEERRLVRSAGVVPLSHERRRIGQP